MNYLKAAGGGLAGALIGAAIWAGIAYATHREVGFVAWGIGGLVGLGVRLAAQENDGWGYGILAAGVAVLAIVLGKFAAVSLIVSDLPIDLAVMRTTDQEMIVSIADEVVRERQAKGRKVVFPPGKTLETAGEQKDYPRDVWQEATKRWNQVPQAERAERIADRDKETEALVGEVKGAIREQGFKESFSPIDILWFLLATLTAFRLGSGAVSSD